MVRLLLEGADPSAGRAGRTMDACGGRVVDVEEVAGPVARPTAADAVGVLLAEI